MLMMRGIALIGGNYRRFWEDCETGFEAHRDGVCTACREMRQLQWREGLLGDEPGFVFLGEGFHGPIVGEEGDKPAVGIAGEHGA
jgi:hypothetical protein